MKLESFQKRVKMVGLGVFLVIVLVAAVVLGSTLPSRLRASSCPARVVASQQVAANSAVITWQTDDQTQGQVSYGTSSTSLVMSAPETVAATNHTVPLTLLTPNTQYFYVVKVGDTTCDSSGQACTDSCVPWNFTTTGAAVQQETVVTLAPTSAAKAPGDATPTSGTSAFCTALKDHIGATSKDTATWTTVKKYDMDANNIINGKDVIKCIQSGK